jgi:hypothetical protein
MLSFQDKANIFDFIPVEFSIHDINGALQNVTATKIEINQDGKISYPKIVIDWERDGERFQGYVPTILRQSKEEEIWAENPAVTKNYSLIINDQTSTITLKAEELQLFNLQIYTRRRPNSTSGLTISLKRIRTGKIEKIVTVPELEIVDNGWTVIRVDHWINFNEYYDIIIAEAPLGSNPSGVNIYSDQIGDPVYKISRQKSIDIEGGPETTILVINCLATDQQDDDQGIFINGRVLAEEMTHAIRTKINKEWDFTFSDLRTLDVGSTQVTGEDSTTEYIYHARMEVTVLYESVFEREESYIKEVILKDVKLL